MQSLSRTLLGTLSPRGRRRRLIVVTYHRVPEERDPLLPGEADSKTFDRQIAELSRLCTILPLPEAAAALADGTLPARAACITFDDGYRNNHDVAAPILRRHGACASFFITQGAVQDGIMWNDLVVEAIRTGGSRLDYAVIGMSASGFPPEMPHERRVDAVLAHIKYLPLQQRWDSAMALYQSVASTPVPRLMMTEADVVSLVRQGFDVGGHTVTHPILATLTEEQARAEVQGCAEWLRSVTGSAPVSFAYPNGRPGRDYGPEHVRMVQDAGFQVAASTKWSCASASSDVFQLPRVALTTLARPTMAVQLFKLYADSYR